MVKDLLLPDISYTMAHNDTRSFATGRIEPSSQGQAIQSLELDITTIRRHFKVQFYVRDYSHRDWILELKITCSVLVFCVKTNCECWVVSDVKIYTQIKKPYW
jgi:hypothetical protein